MAYKQKPGRGKSTPFKAMEKYTSSPLKSNGIEEGTVLKKDGKSYTVKSVNDKEVVVSTGTGIARISNKQAKSMYARTLEDASKKSTRSDLATSTSTPKRDEAIAADMKESSIANYEKRKHLFKKD